MSTLWTPGGERPVGGTTPSGGTGGAAGAGQQPPPPPTGPETDQELEERMAELKRRLAETPAAVVVADQCFRLFEVAAVHLSLQPPQLDEAQLAIDALGAVVEGLDGRLGGEEQTLKDGLAQLRLAYVQLKRGAAAPAPE